MNLEKILYIVTSTVLVTFFVLIVFIFSPTSYDGALGDGGKVIYYADNISPSLKKIIDKFNDLNKGKVRVETIDLSFDKFSTNERKELLARYLRSKSSRIDLFSVDIIWVPRFSRWALPLNKWIDSAVVKDIVPDFLPTCYYNDSLVAMPLYIDVALMFYRDDLLKKLDDYEEYSKELANSIGWDRFIGLKSKIEAANNSTGKNKPFYIFQADAYEGLMCSFVELMASQNDQMLTKNGKFTLNEKNAKFSIQFLTDLVHKYKISPIEVTSFKENRSYEYFFENDAFAVRGWPGFMSKETKSFKEKYRGLVKAAPLPHIDGSKPTNVFGGWNLMISKLSNKVPEVIKFIEFLLEDDNQKMMYEEGRVLPVKKSLYSDKAFVNKHQELVFYSKLFKYGVHRPMFEDYTGFSDMLVSRINQAMKRK
jgi:multiple sugar transport system substrate-binding protein